jgi:hypothetical protein
LICAIDLIVAQINAKHTEQLARGTKQYTIYG